MQKVPLVRVVLSLRGGRTLCQLESSLDDSPVALKVTAALIGGKQVHIQQLQRSAQFLTPKGFTVF